MLKPRNELALMLDETPQPRIVNHYVKDTHTQKKTATQNGTKPVSTARHYIKKD